MADKRFKNWRLLKKMGRAGDVRSRDVYNEQQFGRSEFHEKQTMTSRVILVTVLVLLACALVWFFLSMAQFGIFHAQNAASSSGPPGVPVAGQMARTGQRKAGPRRLGAYVRLSSVDVSDDEWGAMQDPALSDAAASDPAGVQAGDGVAAAPESAGGSAEDFWDMAAYEGHKGMMYKDFMKKFFAPAPDGSTKFVGRFNGKTYNKLDIFDIWSDVTEKMHWPGYCSLFDSTIENVLGYQSLDADDGRPAFVTGSQGDANQGGTNQGAVQPGVTGENPDAPQGSVIDPSISSDANQSAAPDASVPGENVQGFINPDASLGENPGASPDVNSGEPVGDDTEIDFAAAAGDPSSIIYWLKDCSSWKVTSTLFLFVFLWLLGYMLAKKNLDAQNQLEDTDGLNQYTNDQHIQLPEEVMRGYDWFPDVGAHCPVQVSSMLSHVMLSRKGIKNVMMCKRADKDIMGDDGEPEYLKGEVLLDAEGKPIQVSVPLIDEDFADKLFDSSGIPDDRWTRKHVRLRYDTTDIEYNIGNKDRDRQKDADMVSDMINKYWTLPSYEPQRPAGAYLVDTSPSNTMV